MFSFINSEECEHVCVRVSVCMSCLIACCGTFIIFVFINFGNQKQQKQKRKKETKLIKAI